METSNLSASKLSVFALVMMAVISVDSLRNLPISAQFGLSLISFYTIAGIGFFVPLAWVTSRLAIQYPKMGGSYVWIREAFGRRWGHFAVGLQWLYNIIWYPTIFVFITATLALLFGEQLEQSKNFIFTASLSLFWLMTWVHSRGIRFSNWLNIASALVGTLIPMFIIMVLAAYWLLSGNSSATELHWKSLLPSGHDFKNIGFFSNVLFSILGLEVIAVYAGHVTNPTYVYPRALAISGFLILLTLICSSVALCIMMPVEKITVITGLVDVLQLFFANFHMQNITPWIVICIVIGGLGIASSWMLGLAKSLHVALAGLGTVPTWVQKLNGHEAPSGILVMQAIVYSILLSAFLWFPSMNRSYWILSAATAQFALLYYIILFCAALKLIKNDSRSRYAKFCSRYLPFLGIAMCCIGLFAGFIPPDLS